jgi:homoserine kinase type II
MTRAPDLDAREISRLCEDAWGLHDIAEVEPIEAQPGSAALFRVSGAGGSFLLKQHLATYGTEDIARAARVSQLLADRGFPTPPLNRTRREAPFVEVGESLLTLRPWVDGEPSDPESLSREQMSELGRVLGWCHRLLADLPVEPSFDWSRGSAEVASRLDGLAERIGARAEPAEHDELVLEVLDERRALFEEAGDLTPVVEGCSLQVVHGDFHAGNVIFAEDGSVAAVIDVEGHTQHRVREVYRAVAFPQRIGRPAVIDVELARAFVEGYAGEAPLSAEELRKGPEILRWRLLRATSNLRLYAEDPEDRGALDRLLWDEELVRWLAANGSDLGEELANLGA